MDEIQALEELREQTAEKLAKEKAAAKKLAEAEAAAAEAAAAEAAAAEAAEAEAAAEAAAEAKAKKEWSLARELAGDDDDDDDDATGFGGDGGGADGDGLVGIDAASPEDDEMMDLLDDVSSPALSTPSASDGQHCSDRHDPAHPGQHVARTCPTCGQHVASSWPTCGHHWPDDPSHPGQHSQFVANTWSTRPALARLLSADCARCGSP